MSGGKASQIVLKIAISNCRRRLDTRGFDSKGPIYQAIDKAYCAMQSLHISLHYESLGHGVWTRDARRRRISARAARARHSRRRPAPNGDQIFQRTVQVIPSPFIAAVIGSA
jgi:hypothetical protein